MTRNFTTVAILGLIAWLGTSCGKDQASFHEQRNSGRKAQAGADGTTASNPDASDLSSAGSREPGATDAQSGSDDDRVVDVSVGDEEPKTDEMPTKDQPAGDEDADAEGKGGDVAPGDKPTDKGDADGDTKAEPAKPRTPVEESALRACAEEADVDASVLTLAGEKAKSHVTIKPKNYLVLVVSGEKAHLHVAGLGGSNVEIAGVCVVASGEKSHVKLSLDMKVGRLIYIGSGEKSHGSLEIREGAAVTSTRVNLSGEKAHAKISGKGSFSCDDVTVTGEKAKLQCKPSGHH